MALFITSLNSGSNGNCYFIGNGSEAVFIDAGLSCRDTEERMARLNLSMDTVKAIFVSHEHSDHILGLPVLALKYGLPVYVTAATGKELRSRKLQPFVRVFEGAVPVTIGGLSVTPFRKHHDACDPHSFTISDGTTTVGVFTDIGRVCEQLIFHFRLCHAAFLEANYDEQLLQTGRYPWFLKNRIRGGNGHLSNREAITLFREHRPAFMSHLVLAHLSQENNDPALVQALFDSHPTSTLVMIASRYRETPVFHIPASRPVLSTAVEIPHPFSARPWSEPSLPSGSPASSAPGAPANGRSLPRRRFRRSENLSQLKLF